MPARPKVAAPRRRHVETEGHCRRDSMLDIEQRDRDNARMPGEPPRGRFPTGPSRPVSQATPRIPVNSRYLPFRVQASTMHDDFIRNLKWQYSLFSTQDLISIWEERNRPESSYIEETFEAVRQILHERDALPSEDPRGSARQDEDTRSEQAAKDSFEFPCSVCAHKLRIHLPINPDSHACPNCGARYQPVRVQTEPYVLVMVPGPQAEARQTGTTREARAMPDEVKAALNVLGLTEFATFEEAKLAYRNTVKQYHPDKVAHLGPELRVVAERKTKEIVAAYDDIKKFFEGAGR